jgi:flavodoxin
MIQFILYFVLIIFPSNQIDESKTLIIFFSRAGENYNVGIVDKGNTEMIVDYITQVTKIKSFKINPETQYPINYTQTIEIARSEKNSNARPKIKDPLTSIDNYDTILLGYPIWHTNLPNIVMTQLELLNFEGKTIYPFNTHEGSGTGNSIDDIKKVVSKAVVKNGFALRGQNARKEEYRTEIETWLKNDLELQINQNIPDSPVSSTQPAASTTQPGSSNQPGNTTLTGNTTQNNSTEDDEIIRIPQRNNSNLLNISLYLLILNFILIL